MPDSAIQPDVQHQHKPSYGLDRMAQMESIAESRVPVIEEETGVPAEEFRAETPEPKPKEETLTEELEAEGESEPKAEEKAADEPTENILSAEDKESTLVTLKINGEEKQVSLVEAERQLQKDLAGDQKLAEAARRLKEVEEREQAIAERERAAAPAEAEDKEPELSIKDARKQYRDALFAGDEEELERLEPLAFPEGQPGPDVEIIAEQVASKLTEKEETKLTEEAIKTFMDEYTDIWQDPQLAALADSYREELEAKGAPRYKALPEAGEKTREWLKEKTGNPAPSNQAAEKTTEEKRAEKKARKSEVDNLPDAGAKADTSLKEDKPQTHSEIIADMRRSRGLPEY